MYRRRKVQSNGHDSLSIKVALYPPPHDLEIAIIVTIVIIIVVKVIIIITINFDNVVWSDRTGSVTDLLMAPL